MRHETLILTLVIGLSGCGAATNETDARLTATGELVALSGGGGGAANACFSCHGLEGQGDGDSVPRLAGLDAGYLQKQLTDYASGIRPDPVMGPIAKALNDADRRSVSQWYAAMPTWEAESPLESAPSIYLVGDPSRNIVACAACHGATGQGSGGGNPALAGQPSAYTVEQLMRWKRTDRRNDPRGVMTVAAARLRPDEMSAIAVWLERQSPARSPDSAAATSSVAASASAIPAASRERRRLDR